MKKLICLCICLMLVLSAAGCGKKDNTDAENSPISGIRTATADKEDEDKDNIEDKNEDNDNENDEEEHNPDRTAETDRQEIKNNLRDARELIEDGCFEDAEMILDVIRSRKLTEEEKKELLELEKLMLVVSD